MSPHLRLPRPLSLVVHGPLRHATIPLLALAFMAASAVAVLLFDSSKTDLDVFFWPSAEIAVHGHPLLVYTLRAGQYPNANGPVSLLPLSLVVAVINALGWLHGMRLRDAVTVGVFAVFSLLMVREALLAIEAWGGEGRRSAGRAGRGEGREARGDAGGGATRERFTRRLLMSAAFLLAPPLWVALVGFGHIEEPLELWLILLGVRLLGRGKTVWAGICLGLAVMTKSVSAVCLIPLLVALLFDRRVRSAAALAGTAALTAAAVIAPFFLANRSGVVYSLVTYRGELPIVGGSLWVAFLGSAWDGFVRHSDDLLFAGAGATGGWRSRSSSPAAISCSRPSSRPCRCPPAPEPWSGSRPRRGRRSLSRCCLASPGPHQATRPVQEQKIGRAHV